MGDFIENAPLEVKIKLLGSMFPQKIEYDGKKYRTTEYNQVLDLIYHETNKLRGGDNEKTEEDSSSSASVPSSNIFSNRFLADLELIWELRHIIPDPNKQEFNLGN